MSRARLMVVTPSLGGGGAERHLLRILPALTDAFAVSLVTLRDGGDLRGEVPAGIDVTVAGTLGWIRAARRLRAIVGRVRPAAVLSFQEAANIPALLSGRTIARGRRPAYVVSVQSAPSVVLADARPRTRLRMQMAIRRLYPAADRIIVASSGVITDITRLSPQASRRIQVIYNAGIDARVVDRAGDAWTHPFLEAGVPLLVACGRLTEQKDYPTLLSAVSILRARSDVRLLILGDGPLRQSLEAAARAKGIADIVDLVGYVANPYPAMRRADIFVLSSRSEGFGNVLAEALALGRPIVSTDCPHGPGEILEGGRFGRLVPPGQPAQLADGVAELLADRAARDALSAAGPGRAALFTAERSGEAYVSLIQQVIAGAGRPDPTA